MINKKTRRNTVPIVVNKCNEKLHYATGSNSYIRSTKLSDILSNALHQGEELFFDTEQPDFLHLTKPNKFLTDCHTLFLFQTKNIFWKTIHAVQSLWDPHRS